MDVACRLLQALSRYSMYVHRTIVFSHFMSVCISSDQQRQVDGCSDSLRDLWRQNMSLVFWIHGHIFVTRAGQRFGTRIGGQRMRGRRFQQTDILLLTLIHRAFCLSGLDILLYFSRQRRRLLLIPRRHLEEHLAQLCLANPSRFN